MLPLFACTLLLSATLLFSIQPMFGKMILPLLGGIPAVWNTCMVFFKAVLLLGYLYAHAISSRLGVRRQILLHAGVLALPLLALPFGVDAGWVSPAVDHPIAWLFVLLSVSIGLPFFAVATSAPLLQRWFASTRHASARDPYFLYAASNAGSLLALLSYPLLVEPYLPLASQSQAWALGYGALLLLTGGWPWQCGVRHRRADDPLRRKAE